MTLVKRCTDIDHLLSLNTDRILFTFKKSFVMKKSILLLNACIAAATLPALAHEGHGHISSNNPLHYLAEPLHAVILVVALAAVGYAIYRFARQKKQS
jgi:uncharacterized membrane protein YidH (DUF202 family)